MRCMVCGHTMNSMIGGNYECPNCGHVVNDLVNRPSNCDIPMHQGFVEQKCWICPVCGRGLAPHMDWCPCKGSEMQITYGTSTGVNTNIYMNECIKYIDKHWDDSNLKNADLLGDDV